MADLVLLSAAAGIHVLSGSGDSNGMTTLRFQGVAETVTAINYQELPGRGWYIFGGMLTWTAGVVMLALPFHSIVVLTLVAGGWLVALGIVQIVRALQVRREANRARQLADTIVEGAAPVQRLAG
jgi:uncharacterized membrane protein HdeD (DUF308 family)